MGLNDVNNTPREIGYAQSIQHKSPQDNWYSQEIEPRCLDQLCKIPIGCIT
jgi:hypothetical protein